MEDLKLLIRMKHITMWKIADVIGISEPTLYRWMRKYNAEHHEKIMKAISKIERGEDYEQNGKEEC